MPQELAEQMPVLKQLLTDLGFVQVSKPGWEADDILGTLAAANEAAQRVVAPGVRFCDIDRAAREVIEEAGYGPFFTHRLGHQIGLDVHEPGDVSSVHEAPVEVGMCFSIEPGIYLPGEFGVRIEDLVIVTEDGCEPPVERRGANRRAGSPALTRGPITPVPPARGGSR